MPVCKVSGNSQNCLHDGVMASEKFMVGRAIIIFANDEARPFLPLEFCRSRVFLFHYVEGSDCQSGLAQQKLDQRLLGVQPILCFIPDNRVWIIHKLSRYLLAAMCW